MDELFECPVCRSPGASIVGMRISRVIDPPPDIQQAGTNAVLGHVLRCDAVATETRLCRVCRHMFLTPTFSGEEIERLYSAECRTETKRQYRLSEAVSGRSWAEQNGIDPANQGELLAVSKAYRPRRLRQLVEGGRVTRRISSILDFGAMTGELTRDFHNVRRYAFDKELRALEDPDVTPISSEAELLELAPFDLIVLSHVLEHVPNPTQLVERLAGLIGDSGLLYVEVPIEYCGTLFKRRGIPIGEHVNFFSRSSLLRCVERAGLTRILLCAREIVPYGESTGPVLKILAARGQGRVWLRRRSWWPLDLVVDTILTLRARKFPPTFA